MPIQNRDLGKYKRPDVFLTETDQSVIELPVQDVLVNLVPGFSKKGPFNSPIYVSNPSDFESIFGEDDRQLENKKSYFHKTVKQMLKSGPIWALNLLSTDPNRDQLQWQSISLSAQYENSDLNTAPYEYFFNRQDFWERETEAFLSIVKSENSGVQDDDRLFHITNMGDKDITVFMFKSSITGFDVTAEDWYGDKTKVPGYIDYRDWMSDYIVTVLVIGGDWTDYRTLANDTTYSKFFDRNGLIKSKVVDFVNERTVSVLATYDVSLLPYFKDIDNRDMYITNIINNNTDRTGLFCTYNEDVLLETDFKLGNLDIVGDVIVGEDKVSVKFLSYDTVLKEKLTYTQTYLDSTNNVFSNDSTALIRESGGTSGIENRTAVYTNGHTYNMYASSYAGVSGDTLSLFEFTLGTGAYYVINGSILNPLDPLSAVTLSSTTDDSSRYDVLYLTSDTTEVGILYGSKRTSSMDAVKPDFRFSLNSTIILGYLKHERSGGTYTIAYTPVSVAPASAPNDMNGFLAVTNLTLTDVVPAIGDSYLNIAFDGTSGMTGIYNDYGYLRSKKLYDEMSDNIISDKSVLIALSGANFVLGDKAPITSTSFVDSTTTANSNVKLYLTSPSSYHTGNTFLLYYVDNEFLLHDNYTVMLRTVYNELSLVPDYDTNKKIGIVAKYSQFYQDYFNGVVSNLDYFYIDNTGTTKVYLKTYLDTNEVLTMVFLAEHETDTIYPIMDWDEPLNWNYTLEVYSDRSNWKQSIEIEEYVGDDLMTVQQISVDKTRYSEIKRGDYLAAYYDVENWLPPSGEGYLEGSVPRKLTRIINIKNSTSDTTLKILYTDAPIMIYDTNISTGVTTSAIDYQTFTYPSIEEYVTNYKGLKISPFIVHTDSVPDGTDSRINDILNVISLDKNLCKALADKNKISWRYLVDSFGLGLEPIDGFGSKQQLVDLTGLKLNSMSFINMPSARDFRDSNNPSFVNDDGSLNLEYVSNGADESKNPDYLYQFAMRHGEVDGRSTAGYFFPYVRIYDNGIPKWFPPASIAATTYMAKFVSNVAGMLPWTIAAGITNGRVQGITKTEMDFNGEDLNWLHQMGANPIVYRLNNGYCINDESTAQVFPFSSLSFLHSREVLIELENRLYDMLLRFQWSFNTPEIRAEIKYRADKICKEILDSNGFYDFYNICDETNNTDYIIDLQMGVLDTYVEIIKGMGIIVNNITILKKGDIQSGGFASIS